MKRIAIGIALGATAGVIGIIAYELTNQQIAGWLIAGILLGAGAQMPPHATGSWPWWGMLGGSIILVTWLVGRIVHYPVLIAWPILGAVLGCLAPARGLGARIGGGAIGMMAGLLGMGILPLITQVLLPILNLPTFFDYDVDVLGLVVVGGLIGGALAWLKGEEGETEKKNTRRIAARGKKR
jgi:hypothetical protein